MANARRYLLVMADKTKTTANALANVIINAYIVIKLYKYIAIYRVQLD